MSHTNAPQVTHAVVQYHKLEVVKETTNNIGRVGSHFSEDQKPVKCETFFLYPADLKPTILKFVHP